MEVRRTTLGRLFFGLAVIGLSPPQAGLSAQEWAKEMFNHTSHDFGTVARGAKAEHRFILENIYQEDVRISDLRVSCGCTKPQVSKRLLKTWEKAEITATLDTRGFMGRKDATITVVFDLPFKAEVPLQVHSYIRSDLVLQPEAVRFGSVAQGASAQRKVTVSYAGRNDWKIERVESSKPHLAAEAVLAGRAERQATYELVVTLKDTAPPGYFCDDLILVTNDNNPRSSRVPVPVEGVVVTGLTVRPSPLMLGVVEAGQSVSRQLVIQGVAPFRILGATCADERIRFSVPQTAKNVHLLPVTFTAGQAPEEFTGKIRIETDAAAGRVTEVAVQAQVVPRR